jgi:hypothetical protein
MFDETDVTLTPHSYVEPSSFYFADRNDHGNMYALKETYAGYVQEVYPPSHAKNISKIQYEYSVEAVGKQNSYMLFHCIVSDKFGNTNDYEMYTLKKGQKVVVAPVLGSATSGVIVGGLRNFAAFKEEGKGHHWIRRFNKITNMVSEKSEYTIKHDDGTEIKLEKDKITLTDGGTNKVTIDKTGKKITIEDGAGEKIIFDQSAKKLTIEAKDMTLTLKGDLKADVTGKADIAVKKAVTLEAKGKVQIKSAVKVEIKGLQIDLGEGTAPIVTGGPNGTHPVDFITGAPILGLPLIKAG